MLIRKLRSFIKLMISNIVTLWNYLKIYILEENITLGKSVVIGGGCVIKTTDGGMTWEQVLFVGAQAGIIDMVMDPNDANTLFAAGWDRYRSNTQSITSGPAAKIHKSTDGGATWSIVEDSLPQYDLSRIGLAVYPSNPKFMRFISELI